MVVFYYIGIYYIEIAISIRKLKNTKNFICFIVFHTALSKIFCYFYFSLCKYINATKNIGLIYFKIYSLEIKISIFNQINFAIINRKIIFSLKYFRNYPFFICDEKKLEKAHHVQNILI